MSGLGRRAATATAIIALVLLSAACGPAAPTQQGQTSQQSDFDGTSNAHWVNLPDGAHKVLCIFESTSYHNGGPSCDFAHALAR
ncbi:hypothetical protein [Mycobacterium sp. AZCC_0083]|uniref:hypothetical protein n=1 Tax=Mycobacterium sp. AZCC_0083 TaxID=2735882 RepID=UPI00160C117A|nr:hypothetical protein [Mycobacterium sp. AZCC_0083]MBB5167226.1 hypothetical protein [Mycobacterium sp. AZCC_0083]